MRRVGLPVDVQGAPAEEDVVVAAAGAGGGAEDDVDEAGEVPAHPVSRQREGAVNS